MMTSRQALTGRYVAAARNTFLKLGGWRYAESLYLISGFARGEGASRVVDGRLVVCNDLDLLAVMRRRSMGRLIGLARLIRKWKRLPHGEAMDLVVMSEPELLAEPWVIAHADIRSDYRRLWGRAILEGAPRPERYALRRGDALQLLLNRQASLMYGLLDAWTGGDPTWISVQISKPLLAAMAAALVWCDRYAPSVMEQRCRLDSLPEGPMRTLLNEAWYRSYLETALAFKADPAAARFEPVEGALREVATWYHRFVCLFMAEHYRESADAPLAQLIAAMRARQPRRFDVAWPGWWASWRGGRARWPRWGTHPMIDVYAAHLTWMESWLSNPSRCDPVRLKRLLDQWSVSGYGCRVE